MADTFESFGTCGPTQGLSLCLNGTRSGRSWHDTHAEQSLLYAEILSRSPSADGHLGGLRLFSPVHRRARYVGSFFSSSHLAVVVLVFLIFVIINKSIAFCSSMSDHEPSSETQSSVHRGESSKFHSPYNSKVIEQCLKFVVDFRKQKIPKSEAVLGIQRELAAVSNESGSSFQDGFAHYREILDSVTHKDQPEKSEGGRRSPCTEEHTDPAVPLSGFSRKKQRGRAFSEETESLDEEGYESGDQNDFLRGKRRKLSDQEVKFYPWLNPTKFRYLSHSQGLRATLECYEEWSDDPKFYRTKIITTPGCPSLSTSQWTLLLEGKAVDLNKVFTGRYLTAIDSKQSQPLGKGFELTLSLPTVSHKVKTAGDWGIATDLWTQALVFLMPWREEEVRSYRNYISGIFTNHHYSHHERVLDFDRAVRLLVEQQKFVRLNDYSRFEGLKSSHLSAFGMVAYSQAPRTMGLSGEKSSREVMGGGKHGRGRGEPCHKWNRGECDKEAKECLYFHVCD